MSIVATLRERALLLRDAAPRDSALVIYGEVYGRGIGAAARNYTAVGGVGFRVFDATLMPLEIVFAQLDQSLEKIAAWRENGGQPFMDVPALDALTRGHTLERVPMLGKFGADSLPITLAEASLLLNPFAKSTALLDGSALGKSEGIVIRTPDRTCIAKLRFEDYRRTLGS